MVYGFAAGVLPVHREAAEARFVALAFGPQAVEFRKPLAELREQSPRLVPCIVLLETVRHKKRPFAMVAGQPPRTAVKSHGDGSYFCQVRFL